MKILSIETSCDETAISILEAEGGLQTPTFNILGNALISQVDIHKEYGGVYPNMARREHARNLVPVLLSTLKQTFNTLETGPELGGEIKEKLADIFIKEPELLVFFMKDIATLKRPQIDHIAVTAGPGLEPALWVGILFAQALGLIWDLPIFPINHMEGHIYSPLYHLQSKLAFPALSLLVSGGHTELVYIKDFGDYKIIGRTRDDAVGEAFDKVARLLNLPYPGGPRISALAELHRSKGLKPSFEFPRPMINSGDFDFSYSGLKTSVLYKLKGVEITEDLQEETSHAFEDAAVGVLISKTTRALDEYDAKTLIVAGGVSQNTYLRSELEKLATTRDGLTLLLPEISLTTDNAVMIAITAYIRILKGDTGTRERIRANGNLSLDA